MSRVPAPGRWGALALAVGLVVAGSCGGDDERQLPVQLDRIAPALEAVEGSLGGPQQYSEVNATPSEVNVFVVRDGLDYAYVVRDGQVEPPADSQPYVGPTFAATAVAFDDGVLDTVIDELPDSEVVAFSVTPNATATGVDYIATVRARGGELRALLAPDGTVLSVA